MAASLQGGYKLALHKHNSITAYVLQDCKRVSQKILLHEVHIIRCAVNITVTSAHETCHSSWCTLLRLKPFLH